MYSHSDLVPLCCPSFEMSLEHLSFQREAPAGKLAGVSKGWLCHRALGRYGTNLPSHRPFRLVQLSDSQIPVTCPQTVHLTVFLGRRLWQLLRVTGMETLHTICTSPFTEQAEASALCFHHQQNSSHCSTRACSSISLMRFPRNSGDRWKTPVSSFNLHHSQTS